MAEEAAAIAEIAAVLRRYEGAFREIGREHGVFFTADPASAGRLGRGGGLEYAARRIWERAGRGGAGVLGGVIEAALAAWHGHAVMYDLAAAASAAARGADVAAALSVSRVRFQGTDGVRGKTGRGDAGDMFRLFLEEGRVTPDFLGALAAAFVKLASAESGEGMRVAVAGDGRDELTGGEYRRAVTEAILRGGGRPVDLGICPTPLVPVYCALHGAPGAVVLTASHNPADQNGIKMFLDGRKILPEGKVSDYSITAATYDAAPRGADRGVDRTAVEHGPEAAELAAAAAKAALEGKLKHVSAAGLKFIVDTAHGAYSGCAAAVFEALGLDGEIINGDMHGTDINADSGVAAIEGRTAYRPDEERVPEIVKRLRGGKGLAGIALDGDGDRGYLLVPGSGGVVNVIDGDRLSYHIARYLVEEHGAVGRFLATVESDMALAEAVEKDIGLSVETVCVGDKYLSSTDSAREGVLLGEETSGHVVFPVTLSNGAQVLTGNGLTSALLGAEAIAWGCEDIAAAAAPYAPGVMETFYTYYVDKTLFRRGSEAWEEAAATVHAAMGECVETGELPRDAALGERVFDDEEDMLYIDVAGEDGRLGAVFARSSGTEDKIAVYGRGLSGYGGGMVRMARAASESLGKSLKDPRKPEARAEAAIAARAERGAALSAKEAAGILEEAGIPMPEASIQALLAAMRKEGYLA
ncbi:MAG: hypothetical protein JW909_03500 [Planctomycetes bacterium]|nr:hypothetical protein [Planctomycetota bacterium]